MSNHAGSAYLQHIREQLVAQRDRKSSLEQRGQTSVAVSGGLVTLLLAFSDVGMFNPAASPATARGAGVAVFLLVLGAISGVVVTVPADYAETSVEGMRKWLPDEHWTAAVRYGEQAVAKNLLDIIETAKAKNAVKARWLIGAVLLQVAGVGAMAAIVSPF